VLRRSRPLTINGEALDETSYLTVGPDSAQIQPSTIKFDVVVPKPPPLRYGRQQSTSAATRGVTSMTCKPGLPRVRMLLCRKIWSSATPSRSFGRSNADTAWLFQILLRPSRPARSRHQT
jgi:hypothetical protein